MKKFVCSVCGYVHEGNSAPEFCPICKAPASKFVEQKGEMSWAAEHVVGVAKGVSEDILNDLRMNFEGECSEVGMYLAMARVAHREGYPKSACTMKRQLGRKRSTPLNSQNFWEKWLPIPPKRIWNCALMRKTVQPPAR